MKRSVRSSASFDFWRNKKLTSSYLSHSINNRKHLGRYMPFPHSFPSLLPDNIASGLNDSAVFGVSSFGNWLYLQLKVKSNKHIFSLFPLRVKRVWITMNKIQKKPCKMSNIKYAILCMWAKSFNSALWGLCKEKSQLTINLEYF